MMRPVSDMSHRGSAVAELESFVIRVPDGVEILVW